LRESLGPTKPYGKLSKSFPAFIWAREHSPHWRTVTYQGLGVRLLKDALHTHVDVMSVPLTRPLMESRSGRRQLFTPSTNIQTCWK